MTSEIRTRFAPSPTGYLHIGGVRTALFNWLYARQHAGKFILRIDDTDRERNVDEALAPILEGFRWLGLDWDEGPEVGGPHEPYYQSKRAERYRVAAEALLEKGAAYRDYATTEEIQAERLAAQEKKEKFVYSRKWMAETNADRARFEGEGRQAVVRLKMPREGACEFHDHVRGDVSFDWAGEQDHVIQRADGSCLYHLASVVDDHDMEITHVIRAEEHLSNTPRQIFIARGLGYGLPQYAHLPYVAEPGSKNKLSKRKLEKYLKNADFSRTAQHGREIAEAIGLEVSADTFNPVIVDFYRQVGYLPDAVVNYLLLLGWALDDKTEFFTRKEMIENFSLDRINKAPASLDSAKLLAFQDRYMRELSPEVRRERVQPFLDRAGVKPPVELLDRVIELAGDRIKVAGDILDFRNLFVADDAVVYDEKALEKRLKKPEEAARLLKGFREKLAGADPFDAASLEALMRSFVEAEGVGLGKIIHAVRVAVSGRGEGFGLFDILEVLGRDACLARIDRALAAAAPAS